MQQLIQSIKCLLAEEKPLPFSVYSSVKEQHIFNVPVIKPLLICILDGSKKLGQQGQVDCPAGSFVFLSNSPNIEIRNIPSDNEYFALLIEFEDKDFDCLTQQIHSSESHFKGDIETTLENTLQQFVEWAAFAPSDLWHIRRQEILQTLLHLGHQQVCAAVTLSSVSNRLRALISEDLSVNLSSEQLAFKLAMSESTLRRRLQEEGASVKSIKENVRLGYGLHLVQTSPISIGLIAEQCGYSSQSRFTEKFKQLFGVTPTELRKTKLHD